MYVSTERRFKAVKIGLMRSRKFAELSPIMMLGKTSISDDIPTACTNGRDEFYGKEFIEGLNDKELAFVICHESMHKAARHLTIYTKLHSINPNITNVALDYWINGRLRKADPSETEIAMPRKNGEYFGCYDQKYDGWTVKQIFDDLMQQQNQSQNQSGEGEGQGEGFDEHDWDGAKAMTAEEVKQLSDDVKQAIMQGKEAAKRMGAGSSGSGLGLGDLIKVKVSWIDQLWEYARATCSRKEHSTWAKPNRRMLHQGIYMPTLVGKSLREVVFAPDASGSMHYKDRLTRVLSVMKEITKAMNIDKIHVIYWDGAVGAHETYTSSTFQQFEYNTKPIGGGGTDPTCVAEYIKKENIKPEFAMVLTDGEVMSWGEWTVPVLWAVVNDTPITAPVGKTVFIDEE